MQDIGKQMAASAQASFEETVATFKALSSVKSLKDAFELQASFARSTMEKTLAESGRLTDASLKLTEQALAPITARVSMAVEKFAKVGLIRAIDARIAELGRRLLPPVVLGSDWKKALAIRQGLLHVRRRRT